MIVTHCTIYRYNPDIFLLSTTHILTSTHHLVIDHFALKKKQEITFSVCTRWEEYNYNSPCN